MGMIFPIPLMLVVVFLQWVLVIFEVELVALFLHLGWFGRTTEMG
jgi:hypothetical protein